ncbi:extracellular solute-binding protein [Actinobacteria bacterium YIM 96077]|uniref:ABC transporter substrate-binding protein n=2 Tax=Phytoactinopolyspora halophila TaxID=1981511 RepID=A0A329QTD9_9ACTN|nr:extracellular solute-binding protein [Actinobacteria bacterium YIM 96077]RAW15567.1 ABC transporter substrate-binding protein [Phytoactinopolyspora halophila]
MRSRAGGFAVGLSTAALVLAACGSDDDSDAPADGEEVTEATLTIAENAIRGGKNAEVAEWVEDWVIPEFEEMKAEDGVDVTVEFDGSGADDEDYKTSLALDLQTGEGADVIGGFDGIWTGEFAQADYIQPLNEIYSGADDWEGWDQVPEAVQQNMSFEGDRYGIPVGTDGRVIYYNTELFAEAGLPEDWQPTSWEEILDAARQLQELDGVTPIQINAGTPMGEATTMQGFLPLLAGTGAEIYDEDASLWMGASPEMQQVLDFYNTIYVEEELGDPLLQQEAAGRDNSFLMFSEHELGMLIEGDYLWRSVITPDSDIAPMEDRDEVVGWAKIPAVEPGAGVGGQDFVSMSGGGGQVLNPNTDYPELAWELLSFMNSKEALLERYGDDPRITSRADVNEELDLDEMIRYITDEVLPITFYRPGLEEYPEVSIALQESTEAVVTGTSPADAAEQYQSSLEGIVGDENIAN